MLEASLSQRYKFGLQKDESDIIMDNDFEIATCCNVFALVLTRRDNSRVPKASKMDREKYLTKTLES